MSARSIIVSRRRRLEMAWEELHCQIRLDVLPKLGQIGASLPMILNMLDEMHESVEGVLGASELSYAQKLAVRETIEQIRSEKECLHDAKQTLDEYHMKPTQNKEEQ